MSLVPPRLVHRAGPSEMPAAVVEALRLLAEGHHPLTFAAEHDGCGAVIRFGAEVGAFSDTIDGAKDRAAGRLAATVLRVLEWQPDLPVDGTPCPACGEHGGG